MRKNTVKKIETKNTGGIGIVNLATYTSPRIVEVKTQDWVSYGDDNDYFGYLQDRINGSPTNNAIVNGISQMIFGKGLDATDKVLKPEDYAQAMLLFENDTVERLCNDLKAMGQCAIQIVYSVDKTRILECNHFPIETLRSGKCNDDGEVEEYFYSEDWAQVTRTNKPIPIPAFGFGNKSVDEILYIKPYKTGFYYYAPVDYQGGLQYCELEEEISNYHLNNIMNGLAPSMLINFNNGTPTETEQRDIERNIQNKFSGTSNAGRFILSFNDSTNYGATITPVQLSDAHNQYQFLSDESMRKIMVSHRVISPMLLGIKDNSGFGNNADELQTATILMDNTVIRPFQNLLINNGFNKVLAFNGISLNLYFQSLQPLDANNDLTITENTNPIIEKINGLSQELANKVIKNLTTDEIRSLIGLQSVIAPAPTQSLSEHLDCFDINSFDGEVITDEWELVDKREFNDKNDAIEQWANKLITPKKGFNLKEFITSKPSAESSLDKGTFKVRYEYSQKYTSTNSREFCVNMMSRSSNGVVYRKEDIDMASFQGVNNKFGHEGQNYSLFEFKGGVNCGHFWSENLYRLKTKTDGTPYVDKALSSSEQVDSIEGYNPNPKGSDNAKTAPADMPNNGHHPDWVAKQNK